MRQLGTVGQNDPLATGVVGRPRRGGRGDRERPLPVIRRHPGIANADIERLASVSLRIRDQSHARIHLRKIYSH